MMLLGIAYLLQTFIIFNKPLNANIITREFSDSHCPTIKFALSSIYNEFLQQFNSESGITFENNRINPLMLKEFGQILQKNSIVFEKFVKYCSINAAKYERHFYNDKNKSSKFKKYNCFQYAKYLLFKHFAEKKISTKKVKHTVYYRLRNIYYMNKDTSKSTRNSTSQNLISDNHIQNITKFKHSYSKQQNTNDLQNGRKDGDMAISTENAQTIIPNEDHDNKLTFNDNSVILETTNSEEKGIISGSTPSNHCLDDNSCTDIIFNSTPIESLSNTLSITSSDEYIEDNDINDLYSLDNIKNNHTYSNMESLDKTTLNDKISTLQHENKMSKQVIDDLYDYNNELHQANEDLNYMNENLLHINQRYADKISELESDLEEERVKSRDHLKIIENLADTIQRHENLLKQNKEIAPEFLAENEYMLNDSDDPINSTETKETKETSPNNRNTTKSNGTYIGDKNNHEKRIIVVHVPSYPRKSSKEIKTICRGGQLSQYCKHSNQEKKPTNYDLYTNNIKDTRRRILPEKDSIKIGNWSDSTSDSDDISQSNKHTITEQIDQKQVPSINNKLQNHTINSLDEYDPIESIELDESPVENKTTRISPTNPPQTYNSNSNHHNHHKNYIHDNNNEDLKNLNCDMQESYYQLCWEFEPNSPNSPNFSNYIENDPQLKNEAFNFEDTMLGQQLQKEDSIQESKHLRDGKQELDENMKNPLKKKNLKEYEMEIEHDNTSNSSNINNINNTSNTNNNTNNPYKETNSTNNYE